ncbi:hypothetical protein IG193_06925 [Infirmifilum lucidum]|uniref:Uncharacterized protein n=1 Tax=Infirmifilum lucidum TaxID=2776706 RepID=A0A7L9FFU5_9CREN|nr:hypothetical protein [Infirmifilum lucidum]QOJ78481.1 hypothetical protein IG193_06925 [Infirmifilum lucidum]
MKTCKIRFGVSLEAKLAEDVERIAVAMGTNRSHIVNLAVRKFLDETYHFTVPHECEGIMIISYEPERSEKIDPEIENRKEGIHSRLHIHTSEGLCIEVLHVKAHSNDILEFESSMARCGCKACKFIPCHS